MQKGGWVYILTNKRHTVLYTGVTSNLIGRMLDHQGKIYPTSFTARYNLTKLVYFKLYGSIEEAISEEKRIKGGKQSFKDQPGSFTQPNLERPLGRRGGEVVVK